MTTGERIRAARLQKGMTMEELGEKVGVKFSAIHKYETGKIENLKRATIRKLAVALDVRPSYLMCMDDDKIDNDEDMLLCLYRRLDDEKKRLLLELAESL